MPAAVNARITRLLTDSQLCGDLPGGEPLVRTYNSTWHAKHQPPINFRPIHGGLVNDTPGIVAARQATAADADNASSPRSTKLPKGFEISISPRSPAAPASTAASSTAIVTCTPQCSPQQPLHPPVALKARRSVELMTRLNRLY